jgi:dTDP-4-amino-4,6-dideoxygalactose transaminase
MIRLRLSELSVDRNEVIRRLRAAGVGTSVHFIPIPLHPAYVRYSGLDERRCPAAMSLYPRVISLPMYPDITDDEIKRVVDAVKHVVHQTRRRVAAAMSGAL